MASSALFFFWKKSGTNSTCGTCSLAVAAADTFGRINVFCNFNTHFAGLFALHTADTFGLVKAHVVNTELVKESVKCTKRAKVFAERSVDKHRQNEDDY